MNYNLIKSRPTQLAVSVVAALLLAEVGLRLLGFGHPLIYEASSAGYELAPSQTSTRLGKTVHVNALGLRGPESTPMPVAGVTRFLSLGDSVANGGAQINDNQTYPARVQTDLRNLGVNAEVLNASAGGWAIENERNWLREHGTLGASAILLEINEKDLDQSYVNSTILGANPSFPVQYPTTAIGELIGRYVLPKLGLAKPAADPGSTAGGTNSEAEIDMLAAVTDIEEIAAHNKAKLIIMYWDPHLGAPAPETVATREKLFAYTQRLGIPVVRPDLSALPTWKTNFRDAMHPNATGNLIIAKELANQIKS